MITVLTVDIGGTSVKSGVVSIGGPGPRLETAIHEDRLAVRTFDEVRSLVLNRVAAMPRITTVGISTTGTVDDAGTVVRAGAIANYEDIRWQNIIRSSLGREYDVTVVNDGTAATWGEYCLRTERDVRNTVHFVVGSGVGGGMVVSGRLLRGESGLAGALGHIKTGLGLGVCTCGSRDCVELAAGGRGILAQARTAGAYYADLRALAAAAHSNDESAQEQFRRAGSALGLAIASVVNILNPGLITIGGGIVDAAEGIPSPGHNLYVDVAKTAALQNCLERASVDVVVRRGTSTNSAGHIGAAVLTLGSRSSS